MKKTEIFASLASTPWALQPEYLAHMQSVAQMLGEGGIVAERAADALKAEVEVQAARRQQISASTGGSVVVLPLYGLITQRANWMSYWFGGTTTEGFTLQLRQALADPNVTAIVIDVDSPGGCVSGVDELASEIFTARSKKTIIAISNTLNASAAYYLSSQASELYVMPSSLTGSIGVYTAHGDYSVAMEQAGIKVTLISAGRYKVEGNSYEPLTPDAQAASQKMVDGFYGQFVAAVARGRKVKAAAVKSGFGEGRVLLAQDAIDSGMADKIGTLDTVLARFGVQRTGSDSFSAQASSSTPETKTSSAGTNDATGYKTEPVEAGSAASETTPEAKKKTTEDTDPDTDGQGDDTTEDDSPGDPCACDCDSCTGGDCSGCTDDDCDDPNCTCSETKAKARADHALKLHLQKRRIAAAG